MKTSWVLTNEERRERLIRRNVRRQAVVVVSPTASTIIPRFTTEEAQLTSCLAKVFSDTMYSR
jgi:type III secretory pathway component EscU